MSSPSALARGSFEVSVGLSPEEIVDEFRSRSEVEWHFDRAPESSVSFSPYQAWVQGSTLYVRRSDQAAGSAVLDLELQQENGATRVIGRCVRSKPTNDGLPKSWAVRVALLGVAAAVGITVATGAFMGGGLVYLLAASAVIAGAVGVDQWTVRGALKANAPSLLALAGDVLMPHEVGEGDSPFRALPPGSSR